MYLKKSLIPLIVNTEASKKESVFIFGSSGSDIIDHLHLSKTEMAEKSSVEPNIADCNDCIAKWSEKGIAFEGILHTHYYGMKNLSVYDKEYIISVMKAMPDSLKKLYFPIYVFPDNIFVGYYAEIKDDSFVINRESVEIV